jgi:tryptophan-rich sensory protein
MFAKSQISWLVFLPFVLNIVFNAAFTPLQFKLRSNFLALLDIFLILLTLVWAMVIIYPFAPWISWTNIPYLLWVAFATVLQSSITWLNR